MKSDHGIPFVCRIPNVNYFWGFSDTGQDGLFGWSAADMVIRVPSSRKDLLAVRTNDFFNHYPFFSGIR